ncbi:hypothetical protein ACPEEZ_13505 [Frigoribacterium sp. 2-23]|uniref:hypothetical protein n=1 Tax=Frigoribacterium sp. 2-23 TaxID=3415006 RepID=UPI003C6EF09B
MSTAPETPQSQPDDEGVPSRDEVTVRRAPKVMVFVITGALVGLVVSFVLTALFPFDDGVGMAATFGYFALYGLAVGALLGGIVAVIVDRRASRRARRIEVERRQVDPPESDEVIEGEVEPRA